MDSADRLIRALYALAVEEDGVRFRSLALERVAGELGAAAAAWLTHDGDATLGGEYTQWPADAGLPVAHLQKLRLRDGSVEVLDVAATASRFRRAVALHHAHHDSRLASRVAFWFAADGDAPGGEALQRIVGHMVEAGALALQHFILSDERLSRWGRSNRGTAALIDRRGTVHAASRGFRELLASAFGAVELDRVPFELPADSSREKDSFGRGALRFRLVRADDAHYLIYARKAQPLDELSPREQQIARALSRGMTFKSVARTCGIAVSTVANHASRIYRKLGVYRREELIELMRAAGGARERPGGTEP